MASENTDYLNELYDLLMGISDNINWIVAVCSITFEKTLHLEDKSLNFLLWDDTDLNSCGETVVIYYASKLYVYPNQSQC